MMTDKDLERVATLAKRQVELEAKIAEAEFLLKGLQADLSRVAESDLPALLDEIGITEVRLTDGGRISLTTDFFASVTGKWRDSIARWLRSIRQDEIITREVRISLGKGMRELGDAVINAVRATVGDVPIKDEEGVNAQTLKALIRERLAAGESVPLDELGVRTVRRTRVKLAA